MKVEPIVHACLRFSYGYENISSFRNESFSICASLHCLQAWGNWLVTFIRGKFKTRFIIMLKLNNNTNTPEVVTSKDMNELLYTNLDSR